MQKKKEIISHSFFFFFKLNPVMNRQRRNSEAEHRALYKRTSISRKPEELMKRRMAIDEALRKKHREQLITAKRFRNLTRREEYESAGEDEPELEKTSEHDGRKHLLLIPVL